MEKEVYIFPSEDRCERIKAVALGKGDVIFRKMLPM